MPSLTANQVNTVHKGTLYSALHFVVESGNESAVEALLSDDRIDVALKNKEGKTAADLAQSFGMSERLIAKLRGQKYK